LLKLNTSWQQPSDPRFLSRIVRRAGERESDMFKRKVPEKDNSTAAKVIEAAEKMVQPRRPSVDQAPPKPDPITKRTGPDSCIGSGMTIIGKIECDGPAQVFGQVEGELRASDLLIGDGAKIEGNIVGQNVTICGRVKGSVYGLRVMLQSGGVVEGDIFHQSLSIDEKSLLEGSSRRVENPTDLASNGDRKGRQKKDAQSSSSMGSGGAEMQQVEAKWSEATVATKQ
jgi:cytoskeletal protein CcmA (bactofilin family)